MSTPRGGDAETLPSVRNAVFVCGQIAYVRQERIDTLVDFTFRDFEKAFLGHLIHLVEAIPDEKGYGMHWTTESSPSRLSARGRADVTLSTFGVARYRLVAITQGESSRRLQSSSWSF